MTKQLDHETELALTDFYNAVGDALNALMAKVDARARSEEREACAKVCDLEALDACITADDRAYNLAIKHCAAAIRARA